MSRRFLLSALALAAVLSVSGTATADAPRTSFGNQPMVSDGLAATFPFEAWFWLDRSPDPTIPGYAVPAGAIVRFHFPDAFTPAAGYPLAAVMLHGWAQGAIPAQFTVTANPSDPRTIDIQLAKGIDAGPAAAPGLKAIHVRFNVLNPPAAGDYPVGVEFINAGALTGSSKAVARITATPLPNVAAYNQLHPGRNEDWQHAHPGDEIAMPLDFLLNLPGNPRSSMSLRTATGGSLEILRDGKPIGAITAKGVPVTLTPEAFGPGFARLGIIRVHVTAGATKGVAEVAATVDGGNEYALHVVVD